MQKPPTGHEINRHPAECCLALTGLGNSICSCSHCGRQPTEVLTLCSILTTNLVGKTVKVAVFWGFFFLLFIQGNVPVTVATGQKKISFQANCQEKLQLDMDLHGWYPVIQYVTFYSYRNDIKGMMWAPAQTVGRGVTCAFELLQNRYWNQVKQWKLVTGTYREVCEGNT